MKKQIIIQLIIAFLFTFMCGFCDGYTYLVREGMFSYMQTGNLIKLCISLANGYFEVAFLIPIIAFCLGCVSSVFLAKLKHYSYVTTIALIMAFVGAGFCPRAYIWDIVAVSLLSFVGAMQFQAFNKCLNFHYTSTMCTNNMRLFSNSVASKNIKKAIFYLSIILCFALGVVISTLIVKPLGVHTISIAASIFVIVLILLFFNKEDIKTDKEEVSD